MKSGKLPFGGDRKLSFLDIFKDKHLYFFLYLLLIDFFEMALVELLELLILINDELKKLPSLVYGDGDLIIGVDFLPAAIKNE